jgi:hypothetical protein
VNHHLLLILAGGPASMLVPFLAARLLVGRHGDPATATAYLNAHRAGTAGGDPDPAPIAGVVVERAKELTR